MLNLNYIFIGKLPDEQKKYLKENLKENGITDREKSVGQELEEIIGEADVCGKLTCLEWLKEDLSKCKVDESILISGDAAELCEAARLGMAALAYLPPLKRSESPDCKTTYVNAGEVPGNLVLPANIDAMPDDTAPENMVMSEMPDNPTPPADMYAEGFEEIDVTFLQHVYERHHHIPWTILTTERCVVKEFSMEYLDDLFTLYEGEGMTDYMEPLFPYEQEKEYQQAYIESMYGFFGYGMWIVCEKETGKLIGRAGVEHREEFGGELELGYAIGVPYQRKGYATEVCEAILAYAGEELGFSEVYCLIEEGNHVSEHFAGKLGFSYQETLDMDGKMMRKYRYCLEQP